MAKGKKKNKDAGFRWPCVEMCKDLSEGFQTIKQLNNANVYAVLYIENLTNVFMSSLWQKVLNPYMLVLSGHDKIAVGNAITVSGFTRAIVGVFAGKVLIDKMGVDGCSAIAGLLGFLGVAVNLWCMQEASIPMIYVLNFVWAIYSGLANSCLETGWARSVIQEKRQDASGARQVLNKLTTAFGPLFTMVIFTFSGGSDWTIPIMTSVMLTGTFLSILPVIFNFLLSRTQEVRQDVCLSEIEQILFLNDALDPDKLEDKSFPDDPNGIVTLTYLPRIGSNEATFRVLTADLRNTDFIIGKQRQTTIKYEGFESDLKSKCIICFQDESRLSQVVRMESLSVFLDPERKVDKDRSSIIFELQLDVVDGSFFQTLWNRIRTNPKLSPANLRATQLHEPSLGTALLDIDEPRDKADRVAMQQSILGNDSTRSIESSESKPRKSKLGKMKKINLNQANIIVSCDVLNAVASGMSLKFVNLFLIEEYGVGPIGLLWVSVFQNLATVFLTPMIKTALKRLRASGLKGEIVVSCVWFVALIFMTLLCIPQLNFYVVVLSIIANASLTSCTKAYNRSKLVDSLPPNRVAGYMVWDSLNKANQGGITIFGGQLCNAYGYRGCFIVTSFILLFRWCLYTAYSARDGIREVSDDDLLSVERKKEVEAEVDKEDEEFGDEHHNDDHASQCFRRDSHNLRSDSCDLSYFRGHTMRNAVIVEQVVDEEVAEVAKPQSQHSSIWTRISTMRFASSPSDR